MTASLTYTRSLPVRHEVDVFVAGGGPAGLAAAVTAARQGAKVFLAENQACLGGMGTAGLLPIFMPFGDQKHFYAGGFGREVYERLQRAGGMSADFKPGNLCPKYLPETLKRVYDELVAEAGVEFCLHTAVIDVQTEGDRLAGVVCAGKSGVYAVRAKIYVDATGDGDLAAWAGAPFEKGDEAGRMMPGTLCSLWGGVDWEKAGEAWRAGGGSAEDLLAKGFAEKMFSVEDPHLPGIFNLFETIGGGNVGHSFGVDGTDERSLTKALVWARKILPEYERFYRKHVPGYAQAACLATASLFGVRETRRILGDYVLNLEDYDQNAVFPDEIGRFRYWIDIHPLVPDAEQWTKHQSYRTARKEDGESYGIPYRTLTPRKVENLLVAGRCVSTDRYVQSSLRVMSGCFITGQAAGLAAALAAGQGRPPRQLGVSALQKGLKALGAFLPNC